MENESFQVYSKLVQEIAKGMEQVQNLQASSSSGNQEISALEKMVPAYAEALSILIEMDPTQGQCDLITDYFSSGDSMERNSLHKITTRVGVDADSLPAGTYLHDQGPLDDGFSWRKLGQKVILGSRYSRNYYRCTHHFSRGCRATKTTQRLGDDPSVFDTVYRFTHTCAGTVHVPPPPSEESTKLAHTG